MQIKLQELLTMLFKKYKSDIPKPLEHPDEETLACFLENKLDSRESEKLKEHLILCQDCLDAFLIGLKTSSVSLQDVPEELRQVVRNLVPGKEKPTDLLEIALRFKDKFIELMHTNGDVLVGLELVPAPVLRCRNIQDFKDEINILKEFKDTRVEMKIVNSGNNMFSISVWAKDKKTQNVLKDLRISLLKDDLELESYYTEKGAVSFEHVDLGRYTLEIRSAKDKIASILIDIKV